METTVCEKSLSKYDAAVNVEMYQCVENHVRF